MPKCLRIPFFLCALSVIVLVITFVFQGFTVGSSRAAASERRRPAFTKPTESQIAEFVSKARIGLPPSTQVIGWREERGGMDGFVWLHVTMAKQDVAGFLDNSPLRGVQLQTKHLSHASQFEPFFIAPPQQYRSGQAWLPNAQVLNILIDDSDTASAQVYLMWHET
jgi:hypothetical protein